MSISVIVPSKDRRQHLERFLPLYLQEPDVLEVIVVVDGSTDGTVEYLTGLQKKQPKIKMLDNGVNRGIPFTKNRGIDAAVGTHIFIAEDDLEITKGFFTTLLKHLDNNKADIACGRNIFRYERETAAQAIARTDAFTDDSYNAKTIEINTSVKLAHDTVQPIIAAPMLGKAEIFRQVHFDERYKVNFWREETDFQFSAQEAGYKLMSCPHAICYNYVIENDRSGVHAAIGLKRARWIIINNWRFINKHRKFIAQHFDIGNRYAYIITFGGTKVFYEVLLPMAIKLKRRLTGAFQK
jgi:GT2 family glycosyltransferase